MIRHKVDTSVTTIEGPAFTVSKRALLREIDRLARFYGNTITLVASVDSLRIIDGLDAVRTVELAIDVRVRREGALRVPRFQARSWIDQQDDELSVDCTASSVQSLFGKAQIVDLASIARIEDEGPAIIVSASDLERASNRVAWIVPPGNDVPGVGIEGVERGWFSVERGRDASLLLSVGARELASARAAGRFADEADAGSPLARIELVNRAGPWIQLFAIEARERDVRVTLGSTRAVFRAEDIVLAIDRARTDAPPANAQARVAAALAKAPRKSVFFEPRVLRTAVEKLVKGTLVETVSFERARGGRLFLRTSRREAFVVAGGEPPYEPVRLEKRTLLTVLEAIDDELEAELLFGSPFDPVVLRCNDVSLVIAPRDP